MLPVAYFPFPDAGLTTESICPSRDPPFTNSRCVYMYITHIVIYTYYVTYTNIYTYTPMKRTFLNTGNFLCVIIYFLKVSSFPFSPICLFFFFFEPMLALPSDFLTQAFRPWPTSGSSSSRDLCYTLHCITFSGRVLKPMAWAAVVEAASQTTLGLLPRTEELGPCPDQMQEHRALKASKPKEVVRSARSVNISVLLRTCRLRNFACIPQTFPGCCRVQLTHIFILPLGQAGWGGLALSFKCYRSCRPICCKGEWTNIRYWVKGEETISGALTKHLCFRCIGLGDDSVRCDWKKRDDQEARAPPQRNVQERLELIKQPARNWEIDDGTGFFMVAWDCV